jgi:hypothetical protein
MFNEEILSVNAVSKDLNDLTFTDYYYRLMLLARSRFEWLNLPNGIDEKWIERYLFLEGKCMFFKDDAVGLMVSKFTDSGILNFYDEPTELTPVATNYASYKQETGGSIRPYINGKECVLIRNNDIMIPTRYTIRLYALRLAEIQRTIDINIEAQQTPTLITCTDKQRFSLMQVYKKWKGHEPVIYGDKSLDTNSMNVLKTDAPIVFDKLQLQKHAVWNEVCTFLGIDNANQDKRERLVTNEVEANNGQIELSASCMLKAREQACKQINELFGTNISVKLRNKEELEIDDNSLLGGEDDD